MGQDLFMEPPPNRLGPFIEWVGGWPQSSEEFSRLVDLYLARLIRYAFRRLGNLHDAEDVVQEVLVHAYADRGKHARISLIGPYLYKMTTNACTDHLRTRKRAEALSESFLAEATLSHIPDPSQSAAAREELNRAEELIQYLPQKQAEVVRLRVFDALQIHEIAEIVGCSPNTVGSRLRYGFRKLREIVIRTRRAGR
jgi:RNA polymerase sigma-70 factor (ECF subfamily)